MGAHRQDVRGARGGASRGGTEARGHDAAAAEATASYNAFLAAVTELVGALSGVEEQPETVHIARLRSRIDYSGFFAARRPS